jgi:DNA-directed RNA polymerase specialized sigma24 family protein
LGPGEAYDAALLRQLGAARTADPPDAQREQEIKAELLARYDAWLRPQVQARLRSFDPSGQAAAEVTNRVLLRLARALENKHEFGKAFWKVALDNFGYALKDFWRSADVGDPEAEPPEKRSPLPLQAAISVAAPDELGNSLIQEAMDLRAWLEGSSDEDIRLLGMKLFLNLSPQQIAERTGRSRAAVHTALSRALKRVRERLRAQGQRRGGKKSAGSVG